MEVENDFSGTLAAFLFIAANAYYPAKVIAEKLLGRTPDIIRFFRTYLQAHMALNLLGLIVTFVHGHYAEERNIVLQMSMLATIVLSIVGVCMYYKLPRGSYSGMKLLHTQQLIFFVWILLIIAGHAIL